MLPVARRSVPLPGALLNLGKDEEGFRGAVWSNQTQPPTPQGINATASTESIWPERGARTWHLKNRSVLHNFLFSGNLGKTPQRCGGCLASFNLHHFSGGVFCPCYDLRKSATCQSTNVQWIWVNGNGRFRMRADGDDWAFMHLQGPNKSKVGFFLIVACMTLDSGCSDYQIGSILTSIVRLKRRRLTHAGYE